MASGRSWDTARLGVQLPVVANQRRLATGLDGLGIPPTNPGSHTRRCNGASRVYPSEAWVPRMRTGRLPGNVIDQGRGGQAVAAAAAHYLGRLRRRGTDAAGAGWVWVPRIPSCHATCT